MPTQLLPTSRTAFAMRRWFLPLVLLLAGWPAYATDWVYTVADGDNLWDLSTRYLDSTLRYEALRKLNNIERPRRLQPGTRIRIPMRWIRSNAVEARVDAVRGTIELLRQDGSRERLTAAGATIGLGDRLRSLSDSSVAVRFADGSVVTLHQDSEMQFDHLSAHGKTGMVDSRLRVLKGRLDSRVEPAVGPGSRFEIHTPSAISAVRGTAYRAASDDSGDTSRIEVIEGRVAVSGGNRSRLVPSGFGTQVARGEAPVKPRALLPAPQIAELAQPIRIPGTQLTWHPLQAAGRYRVQMSDATTFDVVTWERIISAPGVRLPDLPDGEYAARVRGIDAGGLEGRDGLVRLTLDTHPRPPVPLQPSEGRVLRDTAAKLAWTASADAASYRLEIARDAAFTDHVLDRDGLTTTSHTAVEATAPGTWFWRVTSIAADGEVGPPGDVRRWQVKPIPQGVETALSGDDDGLVASWRDAGHGARYQVQLAHDPAFGDLEVDRLTDAARLAMKPMAGQVRYLRVRVVEQDGYRGPWGAVQRIDPPADASVWIVPVLGVLGILLL